MKELNFKDEGLTVDWIGFNIQGLIDRKQVEKIAKYLFKNFEFNSTFAIGPDGKEETLFHDSKNKYQVHLRVYRYSDIYWDGLKINFSGQNGNQFYNYILTNQLDWKGFSTGIPKLTLSRLDLRYSLNKISNNATVESFFNQCYQKVSSNNAIKHFDLQRNYRGFILKIGKRGSPNHYRVYQHDTQIRFELEQRGPQLKAVQEILFDHQIEEQKFEQILTQRFFKYTKKVLVLDENYTGWLIDYLRRQNQGSLPLATGYFNQNFNLIKDDDKKKFFRFLQFLAFSRTQSSTTENFRGETYSVIQFKIHDFMDFIQVKNKNQYQREQCIKFFEELQTMKPFLKIFANDRFESFTVFPAVKTRKEYGTWIAEITILQELYSYRYQVFLPTCFLIYQKDFELHLKLQFIQTYGTESLTKTFYSNEIFHKYKHANNQKKAQLKQLLRYLFQQALKHKLIRGHCHIKFKNKKRGTQSIQIQKLTPLLIGQSEKIYFYERLF